MNRREELFKLARQGLASLIDLVLALEAQVRELRGQIKEVKDRLALNSRNSSKPPCTDGLSKLEAQEFAHPQWSKARRPTRSSRPDLAAGRPSGPH